MKRLICLTLALILMAVSFVACEKEEPHTAPTADSIDFSTLSDFSKVTLTEEQTDYVVIDVESFGSIVLRLYPDVAPETVANFKKLVSEKFYDGLTFHRIIKGFMIQGGCPKGDGTGDAGATIKGEFSANGFENNLPHNRGVLSMARGNENDSASCQFFIVHTTEQSTHLNGQYAAFGYTVFGMDVVDEIASVSVFKSSNRPHNTVKINTVRFASIPADAFVAAQ